MEERSKRITALDGLRGVAALIVLIHHSFLVVPGLSAAYFRGPVPSGFQLLTYSPLHLIWAGGEAVFVFFVLSGFVLVQPLLKGGPLQWRSYYPSRLIRLYVPVVASVLLAVLFALVVPRSPMHGRSQWMELHSEPVTITSVIRNATLIGPGWLNSPLWSLKWEVIFSLLLPVYLFVAVKTRRSWWVTVLAAIALTTTGAIVGNSYLTYLPIFLMGCAIATGWPVGVRLSQRWWALLFGAGMIGITSHWWLRPLLQPGEHVSLPVVLASSAVLVVASARWRSIETALQRRAVQWLGRVSFSLYLVHEPIVVSVALLLPAELAWAVPLFSVPIALVAASLFSKYVERPGHALAKTVGTRIVVRRSTARPRQG